VNHLIADILPLALGIAISPLPIIATVLMLLSPTAKHTGLGFMTGWLAGIGVVILVAILLGSAIPESKSDGSNPWAGVVTMLLGVLLVYLGFRKWSNRPGVDDEVPLPAWMEAMDAVTPARGARIGVTLGALNPKNLVLGISAGILIGSAEPGTMTAIIAGAIFLIVAGSSVWIPVAAYQVAEDRVAPSLEEWRQWMIQNTNAILAIVFLIMGVLVFSNGIDRF